MCLEIVAYCNLATPFHAYSPSLPSPLLYYSFYHPLLPISYQYLSHTFSIFSLFSLISSPFISSSHSSLFCHFSLIIPSPLPSLVPVSLFSFSLFVSFFPPLFPSFLFPYLPYTSSLHSMSIQPSLIPYFSVSLLPSSSSTTVP